ncbi:MAG: VWA domain-containing protein [Spirochaetes bacterium]|nr:VWA domain-containing protein [Spirochaetota bacterium]
MRPDFRRFKSVVVRAGLVAAFLISFLNGDASADKKDLIQIAVLLDTSNSMDGLIGQAKSQLWKIVNELAIARRNGKSPDIEVALYEYGNNGLSARDGFIRRVLPLTGDLDSVSEKLFSLTTYGGDEYCGTVIGSAVKELAWSRDKGTYKAIFIAGNEPFTQGSVNYEKACKNAIENGIIVNTIFCGNHAEGISTKWKDGADLADGKYINIDQDQQIAYIEAPQDKEIASLGAELNRTYLAYGAAGRASKEKQAKQDMNAASVSEESIVQRSVAKASAHYKNTAWDVADAYEGGNIDLEKIKDEDLPDEMKGLKGGERKRYVDKIIKKRSDIQKKINTLNEDRRKYVEKEMKKQSKNNTLDAAIINAVRDQAGKKNYKFR